MDVTLRGALLVAAGAAVGGVARYVVTSALPHDFPFGTLAVNILGSFLLALLAFGPLGSLDLRLLFGVGALGAFTTMSTFALDTVSLVEGASWQLAVANAFLNPGICLLSAVLGRVVGSWWTHLGV